MKKRMNRLISMLLAMILAALCTAALTVEAYFYDIPDRQAGFRIICETKKESGEKAEKTVYKYNKDGTLAKKTRKLESPRSDVWTYYYDNNGHLVKIKGKEVHTYTLVDDKGEHEKLETSNTKYTYTYDKDGKLVKETAYNNHHYICPGYDIYEYDSNGRLVHDSSQYDFPFDMKYSYYSNGILSKTTWKNWEYSKGTSYYNKDGTVNKQVSHTFNDEGVKTGERTETYKYKNGNLIKEIRNDSDFGKRVTTYSYDKNGNITKMVCKDYDDGSISITKCKYNKDGKLIKKNDDGSITTYAYDKNGLLVKEYYKSSYGNWDLKKYNYDQYGNKTKITYKDSDGDSGYIKYKYEKFNIPEKEIAEGIFVKLSKDSYKYDGKEKKPNVVICDEYGKENYFKGKDYTVKYKNNVKPGTGKVIVTFFDYTPYYSNHVVELTFKIKK